MEKGGIPSLRDVIEGMLADGPRPYSEILAACGGDEDALREAIRAWPELIAYDSGGTWTWEVKRDLTTWRGGLPKIPKKRPAQGLFGMFPGVKKP